MRRVPCSFVEAKDVNGRHVGYRCTFQVLFVEVSDLESSIPVQAHAFTSVADLIDNAQIAKECGYSTDSAVCTILVSPTRFTTLYNKICDYVSKSDLC